MNVQDLQLFPLYGMLPSEKLLMEENREAWERAFEDAIEEVVALVDEKSKEYDTDSVFWTKQPFGEISFASSVTEIQDRLVTILRSPGLTQFVKWDAIGDKLNDLIVYSLAWAAWRRVHLQQLDALRDEVPVVEGPELDEASLEAKRRSDLVRRAEADMRDNEREQAERRVPERPPDRTGPGPSRGVRDAIARDWPAKPEGEQKPKRGLLRRKGLSKAHYTGEEGT